MKIGNGKSVMNFQYNMTVLSPCAWSVREEVVNLGKLKSLFPVLGCGSLFFYFCCFCLLAFCCFVLYLFCFFPKVLHLLIQNRFHHRTWGKSFPSGLGSTVVEWLLGCRCFMNAELPLCRGEWKCPLFCIASLCLGWRRAEAWTSVRAGACWNQGGKIQDAAEVMLSQQSRANIHKALFFLHLPTLYWQ